MRSLVELMAACLVDDPEAVRVRVASAGSATRIHLSVAQADLGRVIGREGRTARAMRALLSVAGRKAGRTYSLEIGP